MPVLLIGTLDTKGDEVQFVRRRLESAGLDVAVLDAGTNPQPAFPAEFPSALVFERAGTTASEVTRRGDRGHAVAAAAEGAARIAAELAQVGRIEGVFGLGGSAGTTIGTASMRAVPFGIPKVMVSTLASGQTRPYVAGSDLALFPAVTDIAGLNRISRTVLANAADALAGMVLGRRNRPLPPAGTDRPIVTATMFGVTTPCVTRARERLEAAGCEVLVFHATGVGGQAMESLIRAGQVAAVLDLTTTELADELVGGVFSAGSDRLEAAVRSRLPQVLSVGALDMVNFGPRETVPERFAGRLFHIHNPTVTLMRTTPEENARIGQRMAQALSAATVPTVLLLPLQGVSALDREGQPFHDPEADSALFDALRGGLDGHRNVRIEARDLHINDPAFADEAAELMLTLLERCAVD